MDKEVFLSELEPGQRAVIISVRGEPALRRRLIDMGLTKGSGIEVIRKAPLGDPIDFKVKGYHLSLRKAEADLILIEKNTVSPDQEREIRGLHRNNRKRGNPECDGAKGGGKKYGAQRKRWGWGRR